MKKNYSTLVLLLLFFNSYSQQLSQVTFSGGSRFSWFTLSTDQNVLIRISDDGSILEFGTEQQALRNRNYFASTLQPYQGRVEYYSNTTDSAFRGKIKSIGTFFLPISLQTTILKKLAKLNLQETCFLIITGNLITT